MPGLSVAVLRAVWERSSSFRSDGNAATLACWSRGLYNYTNAPEISARLDDDPTKVWSPAELLAIAFAHPPNFPPGTAYEYCNTNYALLGLMAEKIDGSHWPQGDHAPRQHLEHPPRSLLARLLVRRLLLCSGGQAVPARPPGRGQGRNPQARRLHEPEPFLCLGGRGAISTANNLATWIQAPGRRQGAQRGLSAPVA